MSHAIGRSDRDCDEGCCWQTFCTCGAVLWDGITVEEAFDTHLAELAAVSGESKGQG